MASSSRAGASTVLLDANILIYSATLPFDIAFQLRRLGFSNIRVPFDVLGELRGLAMKGGGKSRRFANLAMEIAHGFEPIELGLPSLAVDDQLLHSAREKGYIIATTDAGLRRRLRGEGLSVIYLKQGRLITEAELLTR